MLNWPTGLVLLLTATWLPSTNNWIDVTPLLSVASVWTVTVLPSLTVVALILTETFGGFVSVTPMIRFPESADRPVVSYARTKSVCSPIVVDDHVCDTVYGEGEPPL